MWQTLFDTNRDQNFVVIAVAMDNDIEAARPWIEEAKPTYPVLIDREHRVAELYDMINVPQAVWIDEQGRMVRPAENAGAFEAFRALNFETGSVPDAVAAVAEQARATYLAAIGDWIEKGADSIHAFDDATVRLHLGDANEDFAHAHVLFRLGIYLRHGGSDSEADECLAEASRLHPKSWNIWRQAADTLENGLAAGPDFWARVTALGTEHYYPPVDMAGMPKDPPPPVG